MSWKDEADRELERRRREDEAKAQAWLREDAERSRKKAEEFDRQQKAAQAAKLAEHSAKFRCAAIGCSAHSLGPKTWHSSGYVAPFGRGGLNEPASSGTDWETPTGLYKCIGCGQWFCLSHIHKERCESCTRNFLKRP